MGMTESQIRKVTALTVFVFVLLSILIVLLDWNQVNRIMGKAQLQWTIAALLFSIISYYSLSFGYVLVNRVFGIGKEWRKIFKVGIVSTALNNILGFMEQPDTLYVLN